MALRENQNKFCNCL